jgi:hypothetical protein
MKKILTYIIALTVGVVVGIGIVLMLNLKTGLLSGQSIIQSDTTAVTIYDTLQVVMPEFVTSQPVSLEVYPIAQVPVLLFYSDTITKPYFVNNDLIIPRTQKYYKDPRYEAWVSGYNPRLDSMNVFSLVTVKTVTNTVKKAYKNEFYVNADFRYFNFAPDPMLTIGASIEYIRNERYKIVVGAGLAGYNEKVKWYGIVGVSYCLYRYKF